MKTFYAGKRVLITGMNGFVGGNIAQKLVNFGSEVYGVDNDVKKASLFNLAELDKKAKLIDADIRDFDLMLEIIEKNQIEIIFHLAAEIEVGKSERDPFKAFETNVKGTYNLCEIARRLKEQVKGFVAASSDKAYGHYSEEQMPYQESYELKPKFAYETSKATGDMIIQSYARNPIPVPAVVTRFCNIYGPGQLNPTAIFPDFFINTLKGDKFKARSNGLMKRDFIYVEDVAELYLIIAENLYEKPEKLRGEVFNFGTNKPIVIKNLVEKFVELVKSDIKYLDIFDSNEMNDLAEIDVQYMDFQKVKKYFNFEPRVGLDEGINLTARWYKDNLANL